MANNQDWGPQVKFWMFLLRTFTVDRRKGGHDEYTCRLGSKQGETSCICLGIVRSFAEWVNAAEMKENGGY